MQIIVQIETVPATVHIDWCATVQQAHYRTTGTSRELNMWCTFLQRRSKVPAHLPTFRHTLGHSLTLQLNLLESQPGDDNDWCAEVHRLKTAVIRRDQSQLQVTVSYIIASAAMLREEGSRPLQTLPPSQRCCTVWQLSSGLYSLCTASQAKLLIPPVSGDEDHF